ncbi:cytochrome ubiquinol oxidase subunit I [Carnobacterium divergens]|uniref:Cytochrome d ubiquinol oxidase subunit I n=2 Tax=Carnobacterium divergens TaxID=2748 RepID=A0A0R2I4U2_CARDV|nr:cytochrome ubiquinol oxidase subunit I [Carnobacterium divergens]KRN57244.1 cytochrome d ubiquinol oxidase subunit I [Carnobacterium divergens DSM 20623]TFI69076.1 cytochrome ubiquinol oxidase subunit I [Carnobacterium divergens]TFI69201.1 cytochrome ubiquinol oxidase subunit I [Carnobacterium divergens]TFI72914.1 cytochrome ubiquinol oxidase subunit I [Carnobacterium divergens]TFI84037.1 cytochrome ubiquinol oxidase subunit I [Carnobacterium divergens]
MGLDIVTLARFQFAMTTVFHYFFVPLSIGLALAVAVMETMYVVKKKDVYKDMAKFWGHIFLLSFAVGVVTGIIQEFQFGMNWSDYSRFVGDIFGAPLAVEALLAFFLESTFIGLWIFGWDKFSKKVHMVFIWLVVFGSMMSAFWILVANSFMQHPVGYELNNGRAELNDFGALLTSPQVWYEFSHVLFGAVVLGGFVVAGLSAFKLLAKKDTSFFKKSLNIGLTLGLIGAVCSILSGDLQTKALVHDQPMKFAATEGLYEDSGDPASWALLGIHDVEKKETTWSLEIPYLLSILSFNKPEGAIRGMLSINKELIEKYGNQNYFPPVRTLFWSFRIMAGSGVFLSLVAILGLWFNNKKKTLMEMNWLLRVIAFCTFVPFIANTAGWLITELGRYPWTVYGVFTIADSVSPNVSTTSLLISNIIYFCLFSGLGAVMVYLVKKEMDKGPYHELESQDHDSKANVDPFEKGAFGDE